MTKLDSIKAEKQNAAKKAAAKEAVNLVQDGMIIGLGTGSTAAIFLEFLADKLQRESLKITAVATSTRIEKLAIEKHIPILPADSFNWIDLTVDGADQVDAQKRLIKGLGGALLKEKIVASSSRQMAVIVDDSKIVPRFTQGPLPIEILPFGVNSTLRRIQEKGFQPVLRKKGEELYTTDSGNFIADIAFANEIIPERDEQLLLTIPGVIETGFFIDIASIIIVGYPDGSTKIQT